MEMAWTEDRERQFRETMELKEEFASDVRYQRVYEHVAKHGVPTDQLYLIAPILKRKECPFVLTLNAPRNQNYRPYNPEIIERLTEDIEAGLALAAHRFMEAPEAYKPMIVVDLMLSFDNRDIGILLAGGLTGAIVRHRRVPGPPDPPRPARPTEVA